MNANATPELMNTLGQQAKAASAHMAKAPAAVKLRALREEQVEAERILLATESALGQDLDLLSSAERDEIDACIVQLRHGAQGSDHQAIKAAIDALARSTEEFAARRMDRNVRAALTGKKLDEIA
jgi:molecular chaperone HscA